MVEPRHVKGKSQKSNKLNPELLSKGKERLKEAIDKIAAEWESKEPLSRGRGRVENVAMNVLAGLVVLVLAGYFLGR